MTLSLKRNKPQNRERGSQRETNNFARIVKEYFDQKDVQIILDIGSRYGNESITLKRAFPNSRVYAFECNPDAIRVWRNNIRQEDIHLVEKAVSDVDGIVEFYPINPEKTITPHKDGNIGASSLFRANPAYPYEKYSQDCITVESTTIIKWAMDNNIQHIDLVWLDVQGAELKVLTGMRNLLECVKLIHTEVCFKPVYIGQPLFKDIDAFLRSKNFLLVGFENISGWFGDANYINNKYLSTGQKWTLRIERLRLLFSFKYYKKRLKHLFGTCLASYYLLFLRI